MPKGKRLSSSLKAQIVLEVLREDKSVTQIASENQIHPNQIHKWKKQALENFSQLFEEDRQGLRAREAAHEQQLNELYAEIGRLSVNYIMAHNVHIKVGEPVRPIGGRGRNGTAYDGDWQSEFKISAWYVDNDIGTDWLVLNPNNGFVAGGDPGIDGIAFLAHEALHLEQGSALRNSVLGEWQAYQFGVNVKLNMGGTMNAQELAVMSQTTVEGYYDEVQKQYPGYMIKLLPMFPKDNIILRFLNSCVFLCP